MRRRKSQVRSASSDSDAEGAEDISDGSREKERLAGDRYSRAPDQPPLHSGALIGLTGKISETIDAGAHTVFILRTGALKTAGFGLLV